MRSTRRGCDIEPTLTIIMCALNEMGRIQPAVDEVLASIEKQRHEAEVIVLDNGSTDGTREWLALVHHPAVRIELNERNLGKGGSIKKGIEGSRGRYVVIHDPDLEYRADDVWRLLETADDTGAAMVLGSRARGGHARYKYLRNYLGVRFLSWLINVLYGCRVTDAATAMKLMEGDMARSLNLECRGFDLDFELVARVARLEGRIEELRVDYRPRTRAEGKKIRAVRDGLLALKAILRDRIAARDRFLRSEPVGLASSEPAEQAEPAGLDPIV